MPTKTIIEDLVYKQYISIIIQIMSNWKYVVYSLTYFSYATIYSMRMSIPFFKVAFMDFFHLSKLEVGLGDAIMYLTLGISFLLRIFFSKQEGKHGHNSFFWWMMLCNVGFLILPLLLFFKSQISPLYFISLIIFAVCQTTIYPVILQIINSYFSPKKDGCLLGLWATMGDFGTFTSFLILTFLFYSLKVEVQYCLLVPSISNILIACLVKIFKIDKKQSEEDQKFNQVQQKGQQLELLNEQQSSVNGSIQRIKEIIRHPEVIMVTLSISLMKAILSSAMLWLPMYFEKSGFQQFKGLIPLSLNGMSMIGSLFLGFLYQKIQTKWIRYCLSLASLVFISVCFYIIKNIQFTYQNRMIILILIGFIGFFLLGYFNILTTHEASEMAFRFQVDIKLLPKFMLGIGNVLVAIFQIIIGVVSSDDSNSIFTILLVSSILTILVEMCRLLFDIFEKKSDEVSQKKQEGIQ